MTTTDDDLIVHLARFAGVLREHGVEVGIGDEVDAAHALTLVDLLDRDEVRLAFQIALKIRPRDRAVFDALFRSYWSRERPDARRLEPVPGRVATSLPRGRRAAEAFSGAVEAG